MALIVNIMRSHGLLARLVWLNAAVFCLMAVCNIVLIAGGTLPVHPDTLLALPAQAGLWLTRPWTLFTYMFTHEDFLHLLFNMLWLLWFGVMFLTAGNSRRRLLCLYLCGGVAGGGLYMALCPVLPGLYAPGSELLGASASVLALMSATAVLMPHFKLHLFFIGDVELKWVALVMIVLSFLGLGGGNAAGVVAHLGGVACGLLAGCYFKNRPAATRRNATRKVKRRNPFKSREPLRRPTAHNAIAQEKADAARLDWLLDKIHTSGFNSLTRAEREELQALSRKVTR